MNCWQRRFLRVWVSIVVAVSALGPTGSFGADPNAVPLVLTSPIDTGAVRASTRSIPAGCLSSMLPTTPVGSAVSFDGSGYRSRFDAVVWRHPCAHDPQLSVVLMHVTPRPGYAAWICSGEWIIEQNGRSFTYSRWVFEGGFSFCSDFHVPMTFAFDRHPGEGLDEQAAFSIKTSSGLTLSPAPLRIPAYVPDLTRRALSIEMTGGGSGRVVSTPARIDCASGTCRAEFHHGVVVELAVESQGRSVFATWGGDCASAGATRRIVIPLTRDAVCTARFNPPFVDPQTGWWWAPTEPGRGYSIELKNGRLFMASYAYRADGTAVWYQSQGAWDGVSLSVPLTEYGGGPAIGDAWRQPADRSSAGRLTLSFTTPTKGTLTVDNGRPIAIERFAFGNPAPRDLAAPAAPAADPEDGAVRLQKLRDLVQARGMQRVIVRLREDARSSADRQRLQPMMAANGSRVGEAFTAVPMFVAAVTSAGLEALLADPAVVSVHEDMPLEPLLATTAPIIRAPEAWARGFRGRSRTVAVIDTGVDAAHPFVEGRVIAEACFSTGEPALEIRSACPNGADTMIGAGSGAPCRDDVSCFHGTHVAGIAAGRTASSSGVAPDATVMSIQVFRHYPAFLCGGTPCIRATSSDLIRALEHVRDHADRLPIAAVNLSLGGGSYRTYCDDHPYKPVIDQLRQRGIATIVAAGNDGSSTAVASPACVSSAIRVGATNNADRLATFTNEWPLPILFAPGSAVVSSTTGGTYRSASGTSMAAPHVAGAVAILKGARPDASVTAIADALALSGVAVGRSWTRRTHPRIDVAAAHERLMQIETGWWWNAAEPGSGYFIEAADGQLFFSAYSYGVDGRAVWYVAGGSHTAGFFQGAMQEFGGGQVVGAAWRPAQKKADRGTITLRWSSPGAALLVLPSGREIRLARFAF